MDDIVRRAKENDVSAFEQIVLLHQNKVYSLACRMISDADEAYDVSQEVFIKVYRYISSFKGDCEFSTWLYRITMNTCCDFIKKRKKKSPNFIDDISGIETIKEDGVSPEERVEQRENREQIEKLIGMLPLEHRQMIILRDVHGFSYEKIAQITSTNMGTVKSRISRARKGLCELVSQQGNFLCKSESKK